MLTCHFLLLVSEEHAYGLPGASHSSGNSRRRRRDASDDADEGDFGGQTLCTEIVHKSVTLQGIAVVSKKACQDTPPLPPSFRLHVDAFRALRIFVQQIPGVCANLIFPHAGDRSLQVLTPLPIPPSLLYLFVSNFVLAGI